ncbi:MAG: hypothetical protein JWL81_3013 [Verrucomicrobiales bacterium]|nr:hypothetical protein [Verrucomicrobiales bacterium]
MDGLGMGLGGGVDVGVGGRSGVFPVLVEQFFVGCWS